MNYSLLNHLILILAGDGVCSRSSSSSWFYSCFYFLETAKLSSTATVMKLSALGENLHKRKLFFTFYTNLSALKMWYIIYLFNCKYLNLNVKIWRFYPCLDLFYQFMQFQLVQSNWLYPSSFESFQTDKHLVCWTVKPGGKSNTISSVTSSLVIISSFSVRSLLVSSKRKLIEPYSYIIQLSSSLPKPGKQLSSLQKKTSEFCHRSLSPVRNPTLEFEIAYTDKKKRTVLIIQLLLCCLSPTWEMIIMTSHNHMSHLYWTAYCLCPLITQIWTDSTWKCIVKNVKLSFQNESDCWIIPDDFIEKFIILVLPCQFGCH